MTQPMISVITVTYNSGPVVRRELESLLAQDYPSYEIIVLDNASADDSLTTVREFESRGITIIAEPTNLGFAGGNNKAAKMAKGDILFLVNPDITMPPDCLSRLAEVMTADPSIGVLGAKLIAPDGETLLHCGGFVEMPAHGHLIGYGEKDNGQHDTPREVDFVVGAAMAIRRDTWEALGGFDEEFNPAYFEDVEFCYRAKKLGRKVIYSPQVVLTHYEHRSGSYHTPRFWWMHHKNRLLLMTKILGRRDLLLHALPAEMRWFFSSNSKGLRKLMLRLYASTARRLIW